MSRNKTKPGTGSPEAFILDISDERKRTDSLTLLHLMAEISGEPAELWGPTMIGFGRWRYRYESGREGDWFLVGFSPRATAITVYVVGGFDSISEQLARLGKHKIGKGCLYIKRLEEIDLDVLGEIIQKSVESARTSSQRIA